MNRVHELEERAKKRHKKVYRVLGVCNTRWNGTLLSIESLLKMKQSIVDLERSLEANGVTPFTSDEWASLQAVSLRLVWEVFAVWVIRCLWTL